MDCDFFIDLSLRLSPPILIPSNAIQPLGTPENQVPRSSAQLFNQELRGMSMSGLSSAMVALPGLGLLLCGAFPDRWANRHPRGLGRFIVCALVIALLGALVAGGIGLLSHQDSPIRLFSVPWSAESLLWRFGLHLDGVASLMAGLISSLGIVLTQYTLTYLRGEPTQGRFFRWMAMTLGATLLLATAGNLILFTAAWLSTSFGLHQLLTHYPERIWATWAARKKFLISRLGDLFLITAVLLTYQLFGTLEFTELRARAIALQTADGPTHTLAVLISVLLVLGAMTKSAQFPFHSWLPDTMETPTPVSALMHAGVINAGGYLIVRLHPLVTLSTIAPNLLAIVGAITAVYGGLVMLTQTSIKRALAYSTIAQMGFMMLECGLGAYSAALLHIVAHSAYKAHAFLSSGGVVERTLALRNASASPESSSGRLRILGGLLGVLVAFGVVCSAPLLIGERTTFLQPQALVLDLLLATAIAHLLWRGLQSGYSSIAVGSLLAGLAVYLGHLGGRTLLERLLHESLSRPAFEHTLTDTIVAIGILLGFWGVIAVAASAERFAHRPWINRLYVHVLHGFYIDVPARRLTAWIYHQLTPVP